MAGSACSIVDFDQKTYELTEYSEGVLIGQVSFAISTKETLPSSFIDDDDELIVAYDLTIGQENEHLAHLINDDGFNWVGLFLENEGCYFVWYSEVKNALLDVLLISQGDDDLLLLLDPEYGTKMYSMALTSSESVSSRK